MIFVPSFLILSSLCILIFSSRTEININNDNAAIEFIDENFIERTLERFISNSEKPGPQILIGTKMDYLKALFEYMLKKSIEIINYKNVIPEKEREFFIKKIFVASNELIFSDDIKNIFCAEKSFESMLKALKVLDPYLNNKNALDAVLKFAEFSFSNDAQDLIFSLILKHLTDPKKKLPVFKINPNIEDTSIYDKFVRSCYDLMSPTEDNQISPGDLASSICNSPISLESTKILVKIFFNEKKIKEGKTTEIDVTQFTVRLLKTGEIDSFLDYFKSSSFKAHAQVENMIKTFESKKYDHDTILKYMNPENFILQMELSEIKMKISNSSFNRNLLSFYLEIDPEFAKKFIIQLNSHILRIINDFKELKNLNDKFVYLFSAFVFILYIPIEESKFLPQADYEPLLDFTIELFKLRKIDDFYVPFLFVRNVLSLSYVKITHSGLNKILEILKSYYASKTEFYFNYSTYGILISKIKNNEDNAEELFKLVFHFAESNHIDSGNLVPLIFMFRGAVFRNIYKFCVQHRLLSKSEMFLISKNLDLIDY